MDFHNDFVFFKKKEKRERKKIMSSMTDACCSVKGFNFACNTQLRYQVSAQLPCVKRRWYQAVELCGLFFSCCPSPFFSFSFSLLFSPSLIWRGAKMLSGLVHCHCTNHVPTLPRAVHSVEPLCWNADLSLFNFFHNSNLLFLFFRCRVDTPKWDGRFRLKTWTNQIQKNAGYVECVGHPYPRRLTR